MQSLCRKRFLTAGLLLAALAGKASAADLPAKASPAAYDWTGFYLGGHMGYAWGNSNWTTTGASGAFSLAEPIDVFSEAGSFYEGLQAGYDYMLSNRYVIGVESDVSFPGFPNLSGISIGGSSTFSSPATETETYSETALTFGTLRGRIGYAPDNWLFYATGGFAWSYDQTTLTQLASGITDKPFLWRFGWAAGVGIEAPVAPHWTARLEYLFTDYGNSNVIFANAGQRFTSDWSPQELRAGLNYQFGNNPAAITSTSVPADTE